MYKLVKACKQSENITYGSPTLYMYLGVSDYLVERCFLKLFGGNQATSTIRRSHNVNIDIG